MPISRPLSWMCSLAHLRLVAKNRLHRGVEALQILAGLKADQVILAHVAHQLGIGGKQAQHRDIRIGNVQEEADGSPHPGLAQQAAEWNELIVMHPDHIAFADLFHQRIGKIFVDRHVGLELGRIVAKGAGEIVMQGP